MCGYLLPLSDEGTETGKDKAESTRQGAWTTADGTRTDRQTDQRTDRRDERTQVHRSERDHTV